MPKSTKVRFETGFKLTTEKGKLKKKFEKFRFKHPIDIPNGGYKAKIVVICDPTEISKCFDSGASIAGSSSMSIRAF